jgi:hypothetical protein
MTLDKAFDRGAISVSYEPRILVSSRIYGNAGLNRGFSVSTVVNCAPRAVAKLLQTRIFLRYSVDVNHDKAAKTVQRDWFGKLRVEFVEKRQSRFRRLFTWHMTAGQP